MQILDHLIVNLETKRVSEWIEVPTFGNPDNQNEILKWLTNSSEGFSELMKKYDSWYTRIQADCDVLTFFVGERNATDEELRLAEDKQFSVCLKHLERKILNAQFDIFMLETSSDPIALFRTIHKDKPCPRKPDLPAPEEIAATKTKAQDIINELTTIKSSGMNAVREWSKKVAHRSYNNIDLL